MWNLKPEGGRNLGGWKGGDLGDFSSCQEVLRRNLKDARLEPLPQGPRGAPPAERWVAAPLAQRVPNLLVK